MTRFKFWFNKKYPFRRLCTNKWWCVRAHTYDHGCHKHQLNSKDNPELFIKF